MEKLSNKVSSIDKPSTADSWFEKLNREELIASLEKFDRIGKDQFNKETGFPGKSYFISRNGNLYDCKSIFVMAYLEKFQKKSVNFDRTRIEGGLRSYAELLGFEILIV